MSDQNIPVDTDDLDAFSTEFFGQNKAEAAEPASSEEVEDETPDEPEVDAPADTQEDSEAQEDPDDEGEDEEETPAPKPKKNRFQDRIDELTTARREAERKAAALEERLAKLEKGPEPKAVEQSEVKAPTPEDKNEDGTEKYPLGEFDPGFIRDLTKHTIAEERTAMKAEADQRSQQSEAERAQAELNAEWENKLEPARERYPDFQEKAEALVDVFQDLDQQYGDFLAQTIMSMDKGTDVLYYLANNQDVARDIVKSGATKAAIHLGRLEAQFLEEAKPQPRPKVSKAPVPPQHMNKGSAAVKASVPDDTDDLDAFADKFFSKKR